MPIAERQLEKLLLHLIPELAQPAPQEMVRLKARRQIYQRRQCIPTAAARLSLVDPTDDGQIRYGQQALTGKDV